MKDLIMHIAQSLVLVDNPDKVKLTEIRGEQTSIFELCIAKEDLVKNYWE